MRMTERLPQRKAGHSSAENEWEADTFLLASSLLSQNVLLICCGCGLNCLPYRQCLTPLIDCIVNV